MAIWKDARVTWKGVNISSSIRAASLELGANAPGQTAFGDAWDTVAAGGLKTAAIEMEGNWVAGSTTGLDHLFGSTSGLGQSGAVTIRATTAAISAANPEYYGDFVCTGFTPFQGNVGDQAIADISLALTKTTGGFGLRRRIST